MEQRIDSQLHFAPALFRLHVDVADNRLNFLALGLPRGDRNGVVGVVGDDLKFALVFWLTRCGQNLLNDLFQFLGHVRRLAEMHVKSHQFNAPERIGDGIDILDNLHHEFDLFGQGAHQQNVRCQGGKGDLVLVAHVRGLEDVAQGLLHRARDLLGVAFLHGDHAQLFRRYFLIQGADEQLQRLHRLFRTFEDDLPADKLHLHVRADEAVQRGGVERLDKLRHAVARRLHRNARTRRQLGADIRRGGAIRLRRLIGLRRLLLGRRIVRFLIVRCLCKS